MKIFFILLLAVTACGKNNSSGSKPDHSINPVKDNEYFILVNNYRKSIGLRPLKYHLQIEDVAFDHSQYMATGGLFGHGGFSGRCAILRTEFGADACGEIVAMGQNSAEAVLRAWLNSPPHRRSIENPNWTHTGVGLAKNKAGRLYWTQMFLRIE